MTIGTMCECGICHRDIPLCEYWDTGAIHLVFYGDRGADELGFRPIREGSVMSERVWRNVCRECMARAVAAMEGLS